MKWKNNHRPKKTKANHIAAKADQSKNKPHEKRRQSNFISPVPFRFQGKTYKEIAEKAQLDFDYLRRLIKSKHSAIEVDETSLVTNLGWSRIKKVVCSKWGDAPMSKDQQQLKAAKSAMPLTKYKGGGNHGKIIYNGQTN